MAPIWVSLGSLPWLRTLLTVPALTQGRRRRFWKMQDPQGHLHLHVSYWGQGGE